MSQAYKDWEGYQRYLTGTGNGEREDAKMPMLVKNEKNEAIIQAGEVFCRWDDGKGNLCGQNAPYPTPSALSQHYSYSHGLATQNREKGSITVGMQRQLDRWYTEISNGQKPTWIPGKPVKRVVSDVKETQTSERKQKYTEMEGYQRYIVRNGAGARDDAKMPSLALNSENQIILVPGEVFCRWRDEKDKLCPRATRFTQIRSLVMHYEHMHKKSVEKRKSVRSMKKNAKVDCWYTQVANGEKPTWTPNVINDRTVTVADNTAVSRTTTETSGDEVVYSKINTSGGKVVHSEIDASGDEVAFSETNTSGDEVVYGDEVALSETNTSGDEVVYGDEVALSETNTSGDEVVYGDEVVLSEIYASGDEVVYVDEVVDSEIDASADEVVHSEIDADGYEVVHSKFNTSGDEVIHSEIDASADKVVYSKIDTSGGEVVYSEIDARGDEVYGDEVALSETNTSGDEVIHSEIDASGEAVGSKGDASGDEEFDAHDWLLYFIYQTDYYI
ncbi:hypothetical protein V8C35DRAFT_326320 [Trichoderma chlorosporum]